MNSSFITSRPGLEVLKLFSCSAQMSIKFILLINVVEVLTFIAEYMTLFESFKVRHTCISHILVFISSRTFTISSDEHWKMLNNLRAR